MDTYRAMSNRRSHSRFSIPNPGRLTVRIATLGGPEHDCPVVNIGSGGMMIRSHFTLYEGDCVWIRLTWPESPQTVLGEVHRIWQRGDYSLVAIEFDLPLTHVGEICRTLPD